MQSVSDKRNAEQPTKNVIITDLDQSDVDIMANTHRKVQKKRTTERKHKSLCTMTGNFNRSRSADCDVREVVVAPADTKRSKSSKTHSYFHTLLQTKEVEMEKMFQRIVTLQQFNEQFAEENNKQNQHVKSLERNIEELHIRIDNCERCQQFALHQTDLTKQNKELNADLNMLKNLVYRLNVQIENYQDQQRHLQQQQQPSEQSAGDNASEKSEVLQKLESWQLAAPLYRHTLGPLLKSYDEMIRDKNELFEQYKKEFEHFSGELKRVLEDNNKLLVQHDQLKRDVGSWREERTRLQAAVDICRKKAEVHAEKADLAKEKLVEVVHVYEQRVQSLALEVEHVQTAYTRCKSELMQVKSLHNQPQETMANSLQQCKELLEKLKVEHSTEKIQLQQQLAELSKRNQSSEGKLKTIKQENAGFRKEIQEQSESMADMKKENELIKASLDHVQRSRARLKARLRIALQWAQKLEKGQMEIHGTWDALKRLETIVKHRESQVRGLHARHVEEVDKMQQKLQLKEETIRKILKSKLTTHVQLPGRGSVESEEST